MNPQVNEYSSIRLALVTLLIGISSLASAQCPQVYAVSGGGTHCDGAGTYQINLSGSQIGIQYRLHRNGSQTDTKNGTGSAIFFQVTQSGTYTIKGYKSGCSLVQMNGQAIVLPNIQQYSVDGGGNYCTGGPGLDITLSGSQPGLTYQLQRDGYDTGNTISGTGSAITWSGQTQQGNYYVIAISTACGSQQMNGSAYINVTGDVAPAPFNVNGGGFTCQGSGQQVQINLSGSESGVLYNLYKDGSQVDNRWGSGGAITFNTNDEGTYRIKARAGSCAEMEMSGQAIVTWLPFLQNFSVDGGGTYCTGGAGVDITLSGSQMNISYQLEKNNVNIGDPKAGTGAALTWTIQGEQGQYSIVASNTACNWTQQMSGSAYINVAGSAPAVFNVTGGGGVCEGSSQQAQINLSDSENGVSYHLYQDGFEVTSKPGNDGALTFNTNNEGTYTIKAQKGSCGETEMSGQAIVTMFPQLQNFSVDGGGNYCTGGAGVDITLSGSQINISYQLKKSNVNIGAPKAGTGAALTWTVQGEQGQYYISASNTACNWTQQMSGSAYINVVGSAPQTFNVSGGGYFCGGESGSKQITISGAEWGVQYRLYRDGQYYNRSYSPPSSSGDPFSFAVSQTGTYTVKATTSACGEVWMNGQATASNGNYPDMFAVTGVGSVLCAGSSGATIALSGSETGTNYQLINGTAAIGLPVTGTGSALSWSDQSIEGTYTVEAIDATSCKQTMNGSVTVAVNSLPTEFAFSGPSTYCSGGADVTFTLNGSQVGVSYQLMNGQTNTGTTLNGTGSALSWFSQPTAGTYKVMATNIATGCSETMTGSIPLAVVSLTTAYTVEGGGIYCSGGSGVSITLSGSQTGVNYQLQINGSNSGTAVSGSGAAITWVKQTTPGSYTVTATHPTAGCTVPMQGSRTVAPMTPYSVSGGGAYCIGKPSVSITLSASQSGVYYQLQMGGVNSGDAVAGTGSSLKWNQALTTGTYTILGTSVTANCSQAMTGSTAVAVNANPQQYITEGGGSYCPGGTGVPVTLRGSQNDVVYQLQLNGANIGLPMNGTKEALTWNNQTKVGQYTVTALDPNTQCSSSMLSNASVSLHSVPAVYLLSGGGTIPPGSPGLQVQLAGSETGVTYQLRLNNNTSGSPLPGTGSPLNWSGLTGDGIYTVQATRTSNSCASLMDGSPQVTIPMGGSHNVVNNYAFQYKYDARGRMTHKKVPGAGDWIYMVYDNRDRLVLTQDAVQRPTNEWTFTKYDVLDRAVMTGIYLHGSAVTQEYMQTSVVNDYYINLGTARAWYETYTGNTSAHGYDNKSFPPVTSVNVLTVTYYDQYTFKTLWGGSAYNYVNDGLSYDGYTQPVSAFGAASDIKGYVTGMVIKVVDGGTSYLRSVTYYDDRYRIIQTVSDNMFSSTDRTSNLYDFTGKVLKAKAVHRVGTSAEKSISRRYGYDHAGRMLKMWHQIGSNPEVLLAENKYNELGQLADKKLHSIDGTTFKQSVDFRYNIRGWLTSINNSSLSNNGTTNDDSNDLFGMDLGYQNDTGTGNVPKYDGNISSIKWSANQGLSNTRERAYNFAYDPMNRLLSATQMEKNATWASSTSFHENNLSYDLNGNIQSLTRKGEAGASMDVLAYSYGSGAERSNKLMTVTDGADATRGFIDGNTTGNDYSYDSNGNMKEDKNKGVTVVYNYMNLAEKVTKTSTGEYIKYIYDASGRKLSQRVYNAGHVLQKRTDYAAEYFYENDVLKFIHHEEGRIIVAAPAYEYQYHLKDHLGNVRLTFTTKEETISETASFEAASAATEQNQFLRYANARLVQSHLLDITNGIAPSTATGYAQRLSGGANEKFGLAKSMSVMPGDKIRAEVYAKYLDPQSSNWSAALQALMAQVATGGNGTTVVDGGSYSVSTSSFAFGLQSAQNTANSSEAGPKAYLNWLVFDRNYNFKLSKSGYDRLSADPKERGQDVAHEKLFSPEIMIDEPGYIYIYLSNEEGTPLDVYFDNFKVEHVKFPVVQADDYYPFGLTFNSHQRENAVQQNYLYNGKELQDELNLRWMDYGARMYMPEIARWGVADPLSEKYRRWSPYNYAVDNPVKFIDPDGMDVQHFTGQAAQNFIRYLQVTSLPGRTDPTKKKEAVASDRTNVSHVQGAKARADFKNSEEKRLKYLEEREKGLRGTILGAVDDTGDYGEVVYEILPTNIQYGSKLFKFNKALGAIGTVANGLAIYYQLQDGDIRGATWEALKMAAEARRMTLPMMALKLGINAAKSQVPGEAVTLLNRAKWKDGMAGHLRYVGGNDDLADGWAQSAANDRELAWTLLNSVKE
jgi:RHS repeat-associated protein